jgi:hypothetical protein
MTEHSEPDDETRVVPKHRAEVPDDATRVVSREPLDDSTRVVDRRAPDDATRVVHRGPTAPADDRTMVSRDRDRGAAAGSAAHAAPPPPPSATSAFIPGGVTESASDAYGIRGEPHLVPVVRTPVTGPPVGRARPADPRAVEASVARSGTRRGLGVIALVIGSTVVVAVIVAALAILVFGGLL